MDPDAEVERTTSKILKALLITFVFAACENKPSETKTTTTADQSTLAKKYSLVAKVDTSNRHSKTIYLTFDDGPNRGSSHILQVANEEKIPITMFLIGLHITGSPGQAITYSHITQSPFVERQNHSYTHAHNHFDKFYQHADVVYKDFIRSADSMHLTSKIIRTPGRNIWRTPNISFTDVKKTAAVADTLQQKGFTAIGWDVEWRFDNQLHLYKTDDQLIQQINNLFEKEEMKTPNHLVLLAHDQTFTDSTNFASLRRLVQKLKKTGKYNFEVISHYPGIKNDIPEKNDAAVLK